MCSGLQLAQLHSTAVDYVKSGIPAQWNKELDPRKYPHFMEKPRARSYHSTSVLGKLYDMIDKEVFDNRENYKLPFDKRILERFQLDNELLKEARKIKSQYDIGMRRIMGQLEIRTEFEIWSSFVLSRPRVGSDYKIQEKVGRESAGLKKQFRDLCITAAGDRAFDKLGPFVAAMYRVTWEETRIALYEARQPHVLPDGTVGLRKVTPRSMPLISFPWLFADELGKIATGSERLGGLGDLGPGRSWTEPKPREVLETARDLVAMDYTRTSDGRYIHRGEILQLFRHDGEGSDDGGPYHNDGVISSEQGLLTPDNATSPTENDSPVSLGLEETVADDGTDDLSSLVGMSRSRETSPISSQLPATATRTTFDLLSSDVEDGNLASSACPTIAPTYPTTAETTTAPAVRPKHGSADELVTSRAGGGSVVLDSMRSWETVAGIHFRTVTPTPAVGEEEEEEEDVEYEEVEFTEAVVEVEEETVLERAARLG